jgi:GxxExxY protein
MDENISNLINEVKQAAIIIYKELGAGYDESIYEEAMSVEFREKNISYEVEKNTEIFYKGIKVGVHRLDFIVDTSLVVELKAQGSITKSHIGQTRAYLKTIGLNTGLVVNFPYPDKDEPDFEYVELV